MKKRSLIPRTKSGWLSLILFLLLIPAYWDEFQAWRIRHSGGTPAAPVPEAGSVQPAGKVVGVHDGDTITVYAGEGQPQIKVRLAGIDAPELKQAYGNAAKVALSDMVFGKPVELRDTSKDRYGRTVATVIVDGGTDSNLSMVRAGMAWHYKAYSKRKDLAAAEQEARTARRGLWQDGTAVAPWEFRKKPKKG